MLTQTELETKTGPELVAIFNDLPGVTPVKRFTNREVGIKRILGFSAAKEEVVMPLVEPPKKRGRAKMPRGTYNLEGGESKPSYRKNSARGRLLDVLTGSGATFAQLLADFDIWNEDQLHKTIRMTNWYLGFTLTTDEAGIIRASR